MLEFDFLSIALLALVAFTSYVVFSRLRQPLEYRQLSSYVPSVTRSLWAEIVFSLTIGTKKPKDILPFFLDLIKKNGPVVHFMLTGYSYVLLNDPEDLKMLLSSKKNITKGPEYDMLIPWLNEGLLLSSGTKWQNRRKLLTNTFHFKTLDMYNSSINKNARVLVKKLLEASAKDNEMYVLDYVTLCSLDIICETIMGVEMNSQEGKNVQYVDSIKIVCKSLVERVFKFWLWNDQIYKMSGCGKKFYEAVKVLHEYTDNVIGKKRAILKNQKSSNVSSENGEYEKQQKKSLLDLLLGGVLEENPDQLTDKDIREQVDTFLFAGHDTTSIAITMTLLLLGMHPEIQDRTRDELRSIFGDSDRDVTMDDLNAMRYLDAVMKETLRMYPSVPGITRKLEEPLKLRSYTIPAMTIVAIYPYILHRREDIYPNPEEFIPERFLDEANKSKFLFGYLPFSAGPRNCIGQKYALNEMKIVLSNILRKTKIETFGKIKDIQIRQEVVIGLESIPKIKFYEI